MPRKSPFMITLSDTEERALVEKTRQYTAPHYKVVRSKIVLLAASGMQNKQISQVLHVPGRIVTKWRKRFYYERIEGLEDRPRCGKPRFFSP
jgi:transposase